MIRIRAFGRRQRGFTLVEIMVAVVLGLFVMAGMVGIFVGTSRTYREDQRTATVADELALGMALVTEDVEMAGFWGYALDPTDIRVDSAGGRQFWVIPGTAALTVAADCGSPKPPLRPDKAAAGHSVDLNTWTYDASTWSWRPVYMQNNITSASPTSFPCITDALAGTDVLALFRVNGGWTHQYTAATNTHTYSPTTATSLTANRAYLRANNNVGVLWKYTGGDPHTTGGPPADLWAASANDYQDWEYRVSIYYIRSYSISAGDGIPSLCRKYLSYAASTPAFLTECFSQGIEDFQVEFGIDEDAVTPDGIADRYISNPSDAQLARVTGMRIWMLARSVNLATGAGAAVDTLQGSEAGYSNAKTYTLAGGDAAGGKTVVASDNLFRKLGSSTVMIRNPAHLRRMGL